MLVRVICGFQQVIGMSDFITKPIIEHSNYLVGLFELDADIAAERYAILDRVTMKLIWQGNIKPGVTVRHLVRKSYAIDGVIVLMIDDNETFNAVVADGVRLPLVNSNDIEIGY